MSTFDLRPYPCHRALYVLPLVALWLQAADARAENPTVELRIDAPPIVVPGTTYEIDVLFAIAGGDLVSPRLELSLPQGFYVVDVGASDFLQGVCTYDSANPWPIFGYDWRCVFSGSFIDVPDGGVSSVVTVRVAAGRYRFANGETRTVEATFFAGSELLASEISTPMTMSTQVHFGGYSASIVPHGTIERPSDGTLGVAHIYSGYPRQSQGTGLVNAGMQIRHGLDPTLPPIHFVSEHPSHGFWNGSALTRTWSTGLEPWTALDSLTLTSALPVGFAYINTWPTVGGGFRAQEYTTSFRAAPLLWSSCDNPADWTTSSLTTTFWANLEPGGGPLTQLDPQQYGLAPGTLSHVGDIDCDAGIAVISQGTSNPTVGARMTQFFGVYWPMGAVPLYDASVVIRVDDRLRWRDFYGYFQDSQSGGGIERFERHACTVPAQFGTVRGEDITPLFLATYCTPYQTGVMQAGTNYIVLYAPEYFAAESYGREVYRHLVLVLSSVLDCDSPPQAIDYLVSAHARMVPGGSFVEAETTVNVPIRRDSFISPYNPQVFDVGGTLTLASARPGTIVRFQQAFYSPLGINPWGHILVPPGFVVLDLEWKGWYSCSAPPVDYDTVELADGRTRVDFTLGRPESLWVLSDSCQQTSCQPAGFGALELLLYIDPAHSFADQQQVQFQAEARIENAPEWQFASVTHPFTINVPAEMKLRIEPICSESELGASCDPQASANRKLGVRARMVNTGGVDQTNVQMVIPVPRHNDLSGTEVDTTVHALSANGPLTISCSADGVNYGPTCGPATRFVKATAALLPNNSQFSLDIFLDVPPGTPTGTRIFAVGSLESDGLLEIRSRSVTPSRVNLCPGMATFALFFDANQDGVRQLGERGVPNWSLVLTDSDGNQYLVDVGVTGTVSLSIAAGTYALSLAPVNPTDGVWAFTVPVGNQLTVCPDLTNQVHVPLFCRCDDGDRCTTDTCNFLGQCLYDFQGPLDVPDATCDGVDDDCDGPTDEDYESRSITCSTGVCVANGYTACESGSEVEYCEPPPISAEVCDGLDNDCDGLIDAQDPDLQRPLCELQSGVCAGSRKTADLCTSFTHPSGFTFYYWGPCSGGRYAQWAYDNFYDSFGRPGTYTQRDECDGLDNDCDGLLDEDFQATWTTCGFGICQVSAPTECRFGYVWETCEPDLEASRSELCNGLDDNCDGLVDATLGSSIPVCLPADTAIDACPGSPTPATSFVFEFINTVEPERETFECRIGAGPWFDCSGGSFSIEGLGNGSHTFFVRAIGLQGAIDETPAFCVWTVDTSIPDTEIMLAPENPSQSGSATFAFGSTIASPSYFCVVVGGASEIGPELPSYEPCGALETFHELEDGTYTLWVYSVGPNGVIDETPASYTWVIDRTAPGTEILTQLAPVVCDDEVELAFAATGDSLATFRCRLDGSPWAPCSSPLLLAGLGDGTHVFEVKAVSFSGVEDPTPARLTFVVDTTPPTTTILSGPMDPSQSGSATFIVGSDTPGATFRCALTAGAEPPPPTAYGPCDPTTTVSGLADGAYTFGVIAVGPHCGVDETPATWSWLIDSTYPETELTSAPAVLTGRDDDNHFTFVDPVNGGEDFECRLDGGPWLDCSGGSIGLGTLAVGPHTFAVRACRNVTDLERRCDPTPAPWSWTVTESSCPNDGEAPTLTCAPRLVVECVAGGAEVELDAPAASDPCGVSLHGEVPASFPLGSSAVLYTATDGNGNLASCVREVVVVDSSAPTLVCPDDVSAVAEADRCGASIVLANATATDACFESVTVVSNRPVFFPVGSTTVSFTGIDGAGNLATCSTIVTVKDETPLTLTCEPVVVREAPPDRCGWSGTLTATARDNCALEVVTVDETNVYGIGDQTVLFSAADGSGNQASCTTALTVIDVTAPVVTCPTAPSRLPAVLRARASDACGVEVVASDLRCLLDDGAQFRELALADCPVEVDGDTVSVTGTVPGGALSITWKVTASDPSG